MSQTATRSTISEEPGAVAGLSKAHAERRIAFLALGMIQAPRHRRITVDQAWDELFNIPTFFWIKNSGVDKRLYRMFAWALELPNVEPLGDEALTESYDAIERLAEAVLKDSRTQAQKDAYRKKLTQRRKLYQRSKTGDSVGGGRR